MTVRELIAALGEFDPDTLVAVYGYEGGHNTASELVETLLHLDYNKGASFVGAHVKCWGDQEICNACQDGHRAITPAIVIAGHNRS